MALGLPDSGTACGRQGRRSRPAGERITAATKPTHRSRSGGVPLRVNRWAAALVPAFVLCCGMLLPPAGMASAEALPRPAIAVVPFAELGSNLPASVGEIAAELLAVEMSGDGRHRMIERTRLMDVLRELDWQGDQRVDDESAVSLGRLLGAATIVTGSVMKLGQNYTIAARFLDVETGEVLAAVSRRAASEDALADAIPKVAEEYRRKTDEMSASALLEARSLIRQGRVDTARERLEAIVLRHPRNPAAGDALLELARLDMRDRLYFDASERLNSMIDTFPAASQNSEALYLLGECYYLTVFPPREAAAEMLRDIDRIIERMQNPGDPREAIRMKVVLARKAQGLYKTALAVDPGTPHKGDIEARLSRLAEHVGE